jgi:23S rRNA pseudouridine1911/1915/1917 synthase
MVVARTLQAHTALVEALQEREVKREYIAVAQGLITAGRTIDAPMARHPVDRKRMAIREDGKDAVTHFRVAERYRAHCLIEVQLETGRTHQIRVHLASIRHPLLGDQTYGGRLTIASGIGESLEQSIRRFKRQALHAKRLTFDHPSSGETMSFEASLPADLQQLIEELRADLNHG